MRVRFVPSMLCLLLFSSFCHAAIDCDGVGTVRLIKTKQKGRCYSLIREGGGDKLKQITKESCVYNGDMIIPCEGSQVSLEYFYGECEDINAFSQRILVKCDPRSSVIPQIFRIVWENFRDDLKQVSEVPVDAVIRKSGESLETRFWPLNGSTLLQGEPILFFWNSGNIPSGSQAHLIIQQDGTASVPMQSFDLTVGEWKKINAEFQENTSYTWYIEKDDKEVAETTEKHSFDILSKEKSDAIRTAMFKAGEEQITSDNNEMALRPLKQAFYLQEYSDQSSSLDLYADSFRLLQQHERCQENDDLCTKMKKILLSRLAFHIDQSFEETPIKLQVTQYTPISRCDLDESYCFTDTIDSGACAGEHYYEEQQVKNLEISETLLTQTCSQFIFSLHNQAVSKSEYYTTLLHIEPDGMISVIESSTEPITAVLLDKKGKQFFVLFATHHPINKSSFETFQLRIPIDNIEEERLKEEFSDHLIKINPNQFKRTFIQLYSIQVE